MAGRFDPQYSEKQNAEAVRLVNELGLSQREAARRTGMSDSHIQRLVHEADPPSLPDGAEIADMANRLLTLANREVTSLERTYSKHNSKPLDLDRTAKAAKVLIDLDKLLKANRATDKPSEEAHPLAGLLTGDKT